jgi:hypothetical protein
VWAGANQMPIQPVSFGLESRPGRFGPEGGARLINCFVEEGPKDGPSPFLIYCRPGLNSFATLTGSGGFRGAQKLGALAYVVSGPIVNKVDSAGTVTNVGSFPGSSPVFMARNRKSPDAQIALVSDGQRAILSADVVTTIADTDLPPAIAVCAIGGYFVFAISDGRYFWTSIDEGTAIDILDFASAEANPDGLIGIIDRSQEIVLVGPDSIEFHALTGSSSVFERVPQTTLQIGGISGAAIKSVNGVVILPASDNTVRLLNDYSPERISHHDVERDIRALTDKSVLTAQTFTVDGHPYYCLNFPSRTWVCDLLMRKWYEWKSYGENRWKVEGFVDIGGKQIVGDFENALLYELDPDANDDAGDHLVWTPTSGPVSAYPVPIIADELYVDLKPGVGLNSDDEHEQDPKAMLRTTIDDGATWSDVMTESVGKIGQNQVETSFKDLGASGEDGFRFEISMSAPVSRCLTRAALRFTPLAP